MLADTLLDVRADPYPYYRKLREEEPVHWDGEAFLLTRHVDVLSVLRDQRMSSDARNSERAGGSILETIMGQLMLFTDPPDHTRLRTLVNKAFTPRSVETMRSRIVGIVDELLDTVAPVGTMDVITDFAYPLPVIVIAEMLGVPPGDRDLFKSWASDLARVIDPSTPLSPERMSGVVASGLQFVSYFGGLIEQRRVEPRDDLLSALIAAEEEGDRLTQEELLANCILLLIAGHETTMNLIGNATLALLRHPAERGALVVGNADVRNAVEELLRYDSPVQLTSRVALEDLEVAGQKVRRGQQVVTLLGAANHDPARFEDPDDLDLGRSDAPHHVAFGFGIHFCLGAPLARVEAQEAIPRLFRRFPSLEAIGEPEWRDTITLRGLSSLPVRWRGLGEHEAGAPTPRQP